MPTLIAGILYPARLVTGVPLDRVVLQERAERWTQKPDPDSPYKIKGVLETPKEPVKWPVYIFYFKPILVLLNVIPFGVFLVLFARLLDRYAANDWAWFFCLVAAAFGTYLLPFTQTLNNHTIAAFSAFFALYQFLRIWDDGDLSGLAIRGRGLLRGVRRGERAARAGVSGSALLPALRPLSQARPLLYFIPAAVVPIAGFVVAQYAVFGEFKLAYESFGTDEYLWEGSLWKTPLDLDAFNDHPEPYATYLFHMTLGHHGVFSLTPIFLFSALGAVRLLGGGGRLLTVLRRGGAPMAAVAWLTTVLTVDRPGILHLEPQGAELRRVDAGAALAVLADPVLAAFAAQGGRGGPDPRLGPRPCAPCPGALGPLRRLCHAQPLEPSLDPGRARAPGPVPADALAARTSGTQRQGVSSDAGMLPET